MQSAVISLSPSFSGHSGRFLDMYADLIAAHPLPEDEDVYDLPQEEAEEEVCNDCAHCEGNDEEDEQDDDDFEFGGLVSSVDDFDAISADELFANGRMRPLFEVFQLWPACSIPPPSSAPQSDHSSSSACSSTNSSTRLPLKTLFLEDRAVPQGDELAGIPDETYCVWSPRKPQPETCKKSNSTSNSSRRWRLRDILHRSNSDGKDMFVFLAPPPKKNKDQQAPESRPRRPPTSPERTQPQKKTEKEKNVTDRKPNQKKGGFPAGVHYVKSREGDRRRSYLPYRQDIVGLFGNLNLHPHQHR